MVALSKDKKTNERAGVDYSDPVAAGAQIFAGALVVLDAIGYAQPGTTAVGLTARGVAQENVDNSAGADGDLNAPSKSGRFHFANDGTIARVDIGSNAYIVDDQTVADNDGGTTRSIAGVIKDVDSDGVFVQVG